MKILIAAAFIVGFVSSALATSVTDGHIKLLRKGDSVIIVVTGEIVIGDSGSFDRLAANAPSVPVVFFNSPGGSLTEGLMIGETIKTRKFMTVVDGKCASACAYAWLAGVGKGMTPGSEVIFHAPFAEGDAEHADGAAGILVGQYLAEIGVDVKTSMAISGHGPDDYYVLSAAAVNPIVPFAVVGADSKGQQKPPPVAQQGATIVRPAVLAMKCYPEKAIPYIVVYVNGHAAVIGRSGKRHEYGVKDEHDNVARHTFYIAAKDPNQERTLYFAFDYSHIGRDVSAIRAMAPNGYDAKDKCAMDWEITK